MNNNNEDDMEAMKVELVDLAGRIHAWQTARNKTTSAMLREYSGLGSDKTYGLIRRGDVSELDLEQWLANYRAVWSLIEEISGNSQAEILFDDLSAVVHLRRAIIETMKTTGTNRVVILQGNSGIGKTTAIQILCAKYGSRVMHVEAMEVWGDRPSVMLGEIIRKFRGKDAELPSASYDRMKTVQDLLGATRRCLIIDEAHHLGKACLNTLKSLVNTTPGEFVLVAIPTLWTKLESQSYQEARQLSTNRLSERIKLELSDQDIQRYLMGTFPTADKAD
ncbi:MAG: hypothetical protein RIR00_2599, partial [Pseudomonadota bacterium]